MKALGRYATTGFLIVLAAIAAIWPFVGAAGHRSLIAAGLVTLAFQIGAFALLLRARAEPSRFMIWWGVGVLGRVLVVAGIGLALTRLEGFSPAVLLLATAGFFFALLLLEPAFFERGPETAGFAR